MDSQAGLHILHPRVEIDAAVKRLAADITRDYHDKNPLVIGILKGSFIFMADLVRQLDFPLEVDFIRLSSYGSGKQSSGRVRVVQGLRSVVRDRHVLIVEDIVDTGLTVAFLLDYLKKKKSASARLCAFTDKPSRRRVEVDIDYKGLTVPDRFLVGYGLDFDEKYRNLPDICYLE
ncbi:MAG: hypoxanthine phosphoribosyltransferase [Dehalococcoidales bacterium]|nr:hypoxanthine phosphoribosyltransferase [Dehalococcoidales bacterium]